MEYVKQLAESVQSSSPGEYVKTLADRVQGLSTGGKIALGAGLALTYTLYSHVRPAFLNFRCDGKDRVVVVSGCDSGFGNGLARVLDKRGFRVYACCLTKNGMEELGKVLSRKAQIVQVDITKQESVDALRDRLKRDNVRIWSLVNNAGIYDAAHVEVTPLSIYQKNMDVNCFGHIRMVQALVPFVVKGGRIVNTASVAGRVSPGTMSSYACSKYAMEAFSDALRRELKVLGIKVCTVEPTFFKTKLLDDVEGITYKRLWDQAPKEVRERYGDKLIERIHRQAASGSLTAISKLSAPQVVVDAYFHAVGSSKPWIRYQPGATAPMFIWFSMMPDFVIDSILSAGSGSL